MRGELERKYSKQGLRLAGIDEVGRGCIAGPVYAACVILSYEALGTVPAKDRELIRDSKSLTALQRARIVPVIKEISSSWAVAPATVVEIERHGILQATYIAMRRCLRRCSGPIDLLLIDGHLPLGGYGGDQETVVKGDSLCFNIAAASILAKEERDRYMHRQAQTYPVYGFDSHVGYGTKHHMEMIAKHGICPLHRRNFKPVRIHAEKLSTEIKPMFT